MIALQKEVANEVLNKLYAIDPYCIVAGGAPRDWHFGKAATDIDVFFNGGSHTLSTMDSMLKHVGLEHEELKLGGKIPEWYKQNPFLKGVYNLTIDGVKVQLMRMEKNTFDSVLPNFPLSICHAWYKDNKIHLEKHFIRSEKFKAIYKTSRYLQQRARLCEEDSC